MAKDHVGHVPCTCCGEPAEVREQKNGRAYLLCQSQVCGFQGFTRSPGADRALRGRMTPKAPPAESLSSEKQTPAQEQKQTQTPPTKKRSFFDVSDL